MIIDLIKKLFLAFVLAACLVGSAFSASKKETTEAEDAMSEFK